VDDESDTPADSPEPDREPEADREPEPTPEPAPDPDQESDSAPDPESDPGPPPGFPPDLAVVCLTCDGDGWRFAPRGALIAGRLAAVGKQEACLVCEAVGRHSWSTGPGAWVKRHERKPIPGY
jgi:hypothetical protein